MGGWWVGGGCKLQLHLYWFDRFRFGSNLNWPKNIITLERTCTSKSNPSNSPQFLQSIVNAVPVSSVICVFLTGTDAKFYLQTKNTVQIGNLMLAMLQWFSSFKIPMLLEQSKYLPGQKWHAMQSFQRGKSSVKGIFSTRWLLTSEEKMPAK